MSDEPRHAHLDAQADRFNAQAATYSDHHGNPLAQQYRDEFIRAHAFRGGLDGLDVLDAMCGSGEETGFLIAQGANVQGVDISSAFAERYAERWGRPCATASITETGFPDESFDLVYVCGDTPGSRLFMHRPTFAARRHKRLLPDRRGCGQAIEAAAGCRLHRL